MAINVTRGKTDEIVARIKAALQPYLDAFPQAQIDLYRQNPVSVRVRIVDPKFAGMGKPERSQRVWKYLETLPEDVQSDISTVLLLTPDETKMSFGKFRVRRPGPLKLVDEPGQVADGLGGLSWFLGVDSSSLRVYRVVCNHQFPSADAARNRRNREFQSRTPA